MKEQHEYDVIFSIAYRVKAADRDSAEDIAYAKFKKEYGASILLDSFYCTSIDELGIAE